MGLDTGSATGKLMLNVLGSVAAFERDVMLERQREGIAKARADGRYKGRIPTAMRRADEVAGLLTAGHKVSEVVRETGVSRSLTPQPPGRGRGVQAHSFEGAHGGTCGL